ncbi:MAG: monooxygenase, partial [Arenicella sp.]
MSTAHYDAIIIGAGISGISAAYHFQKLCPGKTYKILERRQQIGGTWDLFNYPGIRSDSDMYTFGFSFRPWSDESSIASKDKIIDYLNDTINEYDIGKNIEFGVHT